MCASGTLSHARGARQLPAHKRPCTSDPRQSTTSCFPNKDAYPNPFIASLGEMFLGETCGPGVSLSQTAGILGGKVRPPQALGVGLEGLETLSALQSERKWSKSQVCYLPAV